MRPNMQSDLPALQGACAAELCRTAGRPYHTIPYPQANSSSRWHTHNTQRREHTTLVQGTNYQHCLPTPTHPNTAPTKSPLDLQRTDPLFALRRTNVSCVLEPGSRLPVALIVRFLQPDHRSFNPYVVAATEDSKARPEHDRTEAMLAVPRRALHLPPLHPH